MWFLCCRETIKLEKQGAMLLAYGLCPQMFVVGAKTLIQSNFAMCPSISLKHKFNYV